MKRVFALLLLAALLLAGCAGKTITVDAEAKTISDGKYTYHYTDTTATNRVTSRTIRIEYPNGSYYLWNKTSNGTACSTTYNHYGTFDDRHTSGNVLVEAILELDQETPELQESKKFTVSWPAILVGAALMGLGIWMVAKPCPEPKEEPGANAITWTIVSGYAEILLGIIAILMGFFS